MAENKPTDTGTHAVLNKTVEKTLSANSDVSADGVYDDASSGLLYTVDDVTLGDSSTDDIYIDCVSTEKDLDNHEANNNEKQDTSDTKASSDLNKTNEPLYFELEKECDDETVQDRQVPIGAEHSVEQIKQSYEALGQGGKYKETGAFEDDFQPVMNNIEEDPFAGFQEVEQTVPVYQLATSVDPTIERPAADQGRDTAVGEGDENAYFFENIDPIYDCVPERSSSEREIEPTYLSLIDDTVYDLAGDQNVRSEGQGRKKGTSENPLFTASGVGTVYSIAQQAVAKSKKKSNLSESIAASSMYDMAKSPSYRGYSVDTSYDFLTESYPSRRFPACKQGVGRPVSIHCLDRAREQRKSLRTVRRSYEDGDYDKLHFKKMSSKKQKSRSQFYVGTPLEEEEQDEETSRSETTKEAGSVSSDRLYESISYNSDEGWGSSEFEDDDDDEDEVIVEAPDKPLPPTPKQAAAKALLKAKINLKSKNECDDLDETRCFPVELNAEKHRPPALPDPPDNLTEEQKKKRCVIELTISSERSYINSLERITEDYEKTVLENVGGPKSQARIVFKEAHQLLSHHKMFQIELAERADKWDREEKIGDIFTASFSKTMLVDSYSTYVNSFAAAMDEIKSVQRTKQTFDEFLRAKEASSRDRLSIFGLMVKPIQRFPQFIMILQDLLKYTPHDHHDRGALQLALTELENFTHKLNERKRHSEQQFAARQVLNQLSKQPGQALVRTTDQPRRLIRQDDLDQVIGETGNLKSKKVRILLMNDCIMCVKVGFKEQGGYKTDRYKLKWMSNIRDVELKDSAITPDMESIINGGPGKLSIYSTQIDKPEEDPFHLFADLNEMMHDYPILSQISGLIKSLKRDYYGLTENLILEHTRDLQRLIQIKDEQLRLVNSCSIILSENARHESTRQVFQTLTPSVKHEWCMDFLIAKLATDKMNNPAWDVGSGDDHDLPPAFFMKCVLVDVPRHYTKMKCAIPVFLVSSSGVRLAIQHLWVVTTTPTRGQISIISINNSKPSLQESFKAADVEITCTEHIPGYAIEDKEFSYSEDTVWLGTNNNEVLIYLLKSQDGMRRHATAKFTLPAAPVSMKFVDERVFCGLLSGQLAVFTRDATGLWNVKSPKILYYLGSVISCMKVVDEYLWIALTSKLVVLDIDSLEEKRSLSLGLEAEDLVIGEFVHSGVGIWVSFKGSSRLRLYHLETLENLQEINVASSVNRLLEERKSQMIDEDQTEFHPKSIVTSLSASKGLLWIGTNRGFVLTLPLPRLKDGVPLASGRPKISLHSHRGPVRFLIPINYSTSIAELNRNNSLWNSMSAKRENRRPSEVFVPTPEDISSAKEKIAGRLSVIEDDDSKMEDKQQMTQENNEAASSEIDKKAKRKSQTEIWQEEIEKSVSVSEKPKSAADLNSLPEAASPAPSHSPKSSEKTQSAKPVGRKRSLRESESFKKAKPNLKSKTLSFRSELANRIAKRNLEGSDSEYENDEDDVRRLYGNLIETDEEQETDDTFSDMHSSYEELPKEISTPADALSARKDGTAVKWDQNVRLPGTASFSRHHRSVRGSSTLGHKGATLKKNMCNAAIVVCGGDGYCDWNKKTKQRNTEDACLLLWIYKF